MALPTPNDAQVEQFKDLYEKDFGIRLDDDDAYRIATALVRFVYLTDYPEVKLSPQDAAEIREPARRGAVRPRIHSRIQFIPSRIPKGRLKR